MRGHIGFTLAFALALSGTSRANPQARPDDERRIGSCIRMSARGHAWLERTLWALRDTEGGWVGAAVRNGNGSYDLGPMQVNSWWVPRFARMMERPDEQISAWLRSDPCFNVEAARWIFLSSMAQAGDFWTAVGLYHSRNVVLRTAYARTVWTRYRRRFAEASTVAAASAKPPSKGFTGTYCDRKQACRRSQPD